MFRSLFPLSRGQPLDLRNCQPFVVVRGRDFYSWNKSPDHEQPLEKAVVECFPIVIILNFHPNLEIGMYYYYSEWSYYYYSEWSYYYYSECFCTIACFIIPGRRSAGGPNSGLQGLATARLVMAHSDICADNCPACMLVFCLICSVAARPLLGNPTSCFCTSRSAVGE